MSNTTKLHAPCHRQEPDDEAPSLFDRIDEAELAVARARRNAERRGVRIPSDSPEVREAKRTLRYLRGLAERSVA